jgi:hypothetical protein
MSDITELSEEQVAEQSSTGKVFFVKISISSFSNYNHFEQFQYHLLVDVASVEGSDSQVKIFQKRILFTLMHK